tara:strand:- start:409 stop:705 length:297 start_codon:yes stop_codon:yes gene_type:complete
MEYVWNIGNLTRHSSDGLVYNVEYSYETWANGQTAKKWGTIIVTGSASEPDYIPFGDLTQDIVLGWITGSFDIPAIQLELSSSLNSLITTQSIAGTPW